MKFRVILEQPETLDTLMLEAYRNYGCLFSAGLPENGEIKVFARMDDWEGLSKTLPVSQVRTMQVLDYDPDRFAEANFLGEPVLFIEDEEPYSVLEKTARETYLTWCVAGQRNEDGTGVPKMLSLGDRDVLDRLGYEILGYLASKHVLIKRGEDGTWKREMNPGDLKLLNEKDRQLAEKYGLEMAAAS